MIVPQDLKVLVVDDNAYARSAVATTLRRLGIVEITELSAAAPAVGALLASRYDIVFADWYMPEMNGAALLEIVRDPRFPGARELPVVMMTAYPNRETIARARELGSSEMLVKPFGVQQVATVLGRLLPSGWTLPEEPQGKQILL